MNQIKNLWRDAKRKLNAMNGVQDTYLPTNLNEWMWRHKRDKDHYINDLVKAIAENPKYKVWFRCTVVKHQQLPAV